MLWERTRTSHTEAMNMLAVACSSILGQGHFQKLLQASGEMPNNGIQSKMQKKQEVYVTLSINSSPHPHLYTEPEGTQ